MTTTEMNAKYLWESLERTARATGGNRYALELAFKNTRLDAMRRAYTFATGCKASTVRVYFLNMVADMFRDRLAFEAKRDAETAAYFAALELPAALAMCGVS